MLSSAGYLEDYEEEPDLIVENVQATINKLREGRLSMVCGRRWTLEVEETSATA